MAPRKTARAPVLMSATAKGEAAFEVVAAEAAEPEAPLAAEAAADRTDEALAMAPLAAEEAMDRADEATPAADEAAAEVAEAAADEAPPTADEAEAEAAETAPPAAAVPEAAPLEAEAPFKHESDPGLMVTAEL